MKIPSQQRYAKAFDDLERLFATVNKKYVMTNHFTERFVGRATDPNQSLVSLSTAMRSVKNRLPGVQGKTIGIRFMEDNFVVKIDGDQVVLVTYWSKRNPRFDNVDLILEYD